MMDRFFQSPCALSFTSHHYSKPHCVPVFSPQALALPHRAATHQPFALPCFINDRTDIPILERNLSICKHKNASPRPAACGIPKHRILPPTIKVIHRTMFQGFQDLRTQIYPREVCSERWGGEEKNATCGCCSMTLTNGRSRRGCNLVVIKMGTRMSSSLISSKVHGRSIRRRNHQ